MSGRIPTREEDEFLLALIAERYRGVGSYVLGKMLSIPPGKIRVLTNRVRDADIALCGEGVRAFYW